MDTTHIKFMQLQQPPNEVNFIFQETSPGAVSEAFLLAIVDKIKSCCDALDDFGIVDALCVSKCGLQEEWDNTLLDMGKRVCL